MPENFTPIQTSERFTKDAEAAENYIIDALALYLEIPRNERLDTSCLIRTLEREQSAIGIDVQDLAAMMMLAYSV